MIEFRINIKFSFYIFLSFMMFTVVGTLTHEIGHITVAKYLGYETELHYGSMNYKDSDQNIIGNSEKYLNYENHDFYVVMGGPIQTIFTSFIGLFILWRRESKYRYKIQIIDWLGVFLGLFILREVFNFVTASYSSIFFNRSNFHGDEFRLSRYLGLNEWFIPSITLIIGLMISLFIIFRVIPIRYRFSFIISGLIGGVLGFLIWFGFLGSLLLP